MKTNDPIYVVDLDTNERYVLASRSGLTPLEISIYSHEGKLRVVFDDDDCAFVSVEDAIKLGGMKDERGTSE